MNMLLSMVETMQILLMPPLFDVLIPALPCAFITLMLQIANFDLIEVGEYFDLIFEMPPTDPVTPSLDRSGFGNTYFIHNLGALTLILAIYGLGQLLIFSLSRKSCFGKRSKKCCCFRHVNKYAVKQIPKLFWSAPL